MKNNKNVYSGGFGLMDILFIIFLILKLTHVIDWSWWWVTAPLWGPIVILIIIFLVITLFFDGN